jgi:hypothetical protein
VLLSTAQGKMNTTQEKHSIKKSLRTAAMIQLVPWYKSVIYNLYIVSHHPTKLKGENLHGSVGREHSKKNLSWNDKSCIGERDLPKFHGENFHGWFSNCENFPLYSKPSRLHNN